MVALRLIRWLLSGALVTGAASVLFAGLAALSVDDEPRGTPAIRWTRYEMGLPRMLDCWLGPGQPVPDPDIIAIAWQIGPRSDGRVHYRLASMAPECRAFDHDGDGDVDLFDFGCAANGDE